MINIGATVSTRIWKKHMVVAPFLKYHYLDFLREKKCVSCMQNCATGYYYNLIDACDETVDLYVYNITNKTSARLILMPHFC